MENKDENSSQKKLIEKETCQICLEDYQQEDFDESCHLCKSKYCKKCLQSYLLEQMQQGKFINLRCPQVECNNKLNDDEIRRHLQDKDIFLKFSKFRFKFMILKNPNQKLCTSPNCSAILQRENELIPNIKCDQCQLEQCFKCGKLFHDGKTCDQALSQEEKQFMKDNNMAPCPFCRVIIQKNGGCSIMLCTNCDKEFCFNCGKICDHSHFCLGIVAYYDDPTEHKCKLFLKKLLRILDFIISRLFIFFTGLVVIVGFILIYHTVWPFQISLTITEKLFTIKLMNKVPCLIKAFFSVISFFIFLPFSIFLAIIPGYCLVISKLIDEIKNMNAQQEAQFQNQKRLQEEQQDFKKQFDINYINQQKILKQNINQPQNEIQSEQNEVENDQNQVVIQIQENIQENQIENPKNDITNVIKINKKKIISNSDEEAHQQEQLSSNKSDSLYQSKNSFKNENQQNPEEIKF